MLKYFLDVLGPGVTYVGEKHILYTDNNTVLYQYPACTPITTVSVLSVGCTWNSYVMNYGCYLLAAHEIVWWWIMVEIICLTLLTHSFFFLFWTNSNYCITWSLQSSRGFLAWGDPHQKIHQVMLFFELCISFTALLNHIAFLKHKIPPFIAFSH